MIFRLDYLTGLFSGFALSMAFLQWYPMWWGPVRNAYQCGRLLGGLPIAQIGGFVLDEKDAKIVLGCQKEFEMEEEVVTTTTTTMMFTNSPYIVSDTSSAFGAMADGAWGIGRCVAFSYDLPRSTHEIVFGKSDHNWMSLERTVADGLLACKAILHPVEAEACFDKVLLEIKGVMEARPAGKKIRIRVLDPKRVLVSR